MLAKRLLLQWFSFLLLFTSLTFAYRVVFVVYHVETFESLTFLECIYALLWGLRFDIAVALFFALMTLFLCRLAERFAFSWYYSALLFLPILMLIQTADILYFQDSGRHIGDEMLSAGGDIVQLTTHALHTGLSLIVWNIVLFMLWAWLWLKLRHRHQHENDERGVVLSCSWLLIVMCSVVGIRGGIGGVPQAPIHAYKIGDAQQAVVASNAVYIALFTLFTEQEGGSKVVLPAVDINKQQLVHYLYPDDQGQVAEPLTARSKPYNIVLIFLESWNAAWMRSYNPDFAHDITPHFDQFRQTALSADLTLAGGHRTVEGVFASMCSFQNPLGTSIASSHLLSEDYLCLPEILNQQGYATVFIQGSHRDTGNVGSFAQRLGFQTSLGKRQLPTGKLPHNAWGLQDDDLYDIVLEKLESQQQPFFYAVNTTSTHDTILPPDIIPLIQAKTSQEKHQNVMAYADQAFGRFIQRFEQSAWAANTIIVAVADHTAQIHSSFLHEYMIPMAIKAPHLAAKMIPYATSQRDVAPTLLELLQLPAVESFSGISLLSSSKFFADYYHQHHLGWIEGDYLLDMDLTNQQSLCYMWREDTGLKHPVSCAGITSPAFAVGFTSLSQEALTSGSTKDFRGSLRKH